MKYNVAQDLKIISQYLSFSYEQLAEQIGIRAETISRIINCEIEPSNELLEKIYDYIFHQGINLNQTKIEYYQKNHDVVLFHGSKDEIIGDLSLDYSRSHVDFGPGFYVGDNYQQSLDFVCQTKNGSIYVLDVKYKDLKVVELDLSLEWMLLIAINRGKLEKYNNSSLYKQIIKKYSEFDVIIAPIADNRMFTTIEDFARSAITSEQAIHALKDLSLGKQIVFKSQKALRNISILERLFVSKAEKEIAKKEKIQKILDSDNYINDAYEKYIRQGQYIGEIFK